MLRVPEKEDSVGENPVVFVSRFRYLDYCSICGEYGHKTIQCRPKKSYRKKSEDLWLPNSLQHLLSLINQCVHSRMLANGRYDMELMWGPSILLAAGFIVQEICREKVKAKAQELSFTRNPVYPQYFYHTLEGKEETVGNNNAKDEEIVGTAVLVKKFKNSVRRVCDTCRKRKKACGLIDPTRANELCEAFQRTRGDEP